MYYQVDLTQVLLGYLFDLDDSNVSRVVNRFRPLLLGVLPLPVEETRLFAGDAPRPRKRIATLDELFREHPEFMEVLIDTTEQETYRPKDKVERKERYSGKRKRHTLVRQVWSGPASPTWSAADRLYGTLTAILKNTSEPEIIALERLFMDNHNEELQRRVRATREVPAQTLVDLLTEAKRAGEADFGDPRVVAFILLGAVVLGPRTRFLLTPIAERDHFDLAAVSRATFEAVWRGLTPRPGGGAAGN